MSNELTEAERAVRAMVPGTECSCGGDPDCQKEFQLARDIVAAVRPIIEAEITQHPDVNEMNRGFGDCPQCDSTPLSRCHECGTRVFRTEATVFGWRMDHLSGFGCIALCPDCRNDNT